MVVQHNAVSQKKKIIGRRAFSSLFAAATLAVVAFLVISHGTTTHAAVQEQPIVSTVAGTSDWGYFDGPADQAMFSGNLGAAALDAVGNLFIVDGSRIRKITPDGMVSTVAGTGDYGFADGPADQAQFNGLFGIVVDSEGNLYAADNGNNRIRKITPDGTVTTVAGTGAYSFADGPADQAQFRNPFGIALDSEDNLYVTDYVNRRIRKITPDGTVLTVAGTGDFGSADGPADQATFINPTDIAIDAAGNLYVADSGNNLIRKITPDGMVSTVAGTGEAGFADGPADQAQFDNPRSIAIDVAGDIYVADNNRIRKITSDGMVSTIAGTGDWDFADGPADQAQFSFPSALVIDPEGNLYVADSGNNRIRKITFPRVENQTPDKTTLTPDDKAPSAPDTGVASSSSPLPLILTAAGLLAVAILIALPRANRSRR